LDRANVGPRCQHVIVTTATHAEPSPGASFAGRDRSRLSGRNRMDIPTGIKVTNNAESMLTMYLQPGRWLPGAPGQQS
jgi:hypothetical protein